MVRPDARFTLVIVLLQLFARPSGAQPHRALELRDLFAMKRVSTPAVSPDGKWVAYTLSTPVLTENAVRSDLWLSSIDGTLSRQLTTHPASDRNPAWSPDGSAIAFESARSGTTQIWLLRLGGGEPVQFTTLSTGASRPVWSPDGSKIAFVSEVFPEYAERPFPESDRLNRDRLEKAGEGKATPRIYTQLLVRHWDHWSDGRRIHVFVQPLRGGTPRDLTPGTRDAVPTSSTFSAGNDFAFSPDGAEIAYTATPAPSREEAWSTNHDIFTVPIGGGSPRQITTNPAADGSPSYSPDGRFIAYRAQARPNFEADRWQLMLYDRTTDTHRSLSSSFDASAGAPVWSADGRTIYFDADVKGRGPLLSVSLLGTDVTPVVSEHTNNDISISRDGALLVFAQSSAVRPAEVFSCTVKSGVVKPVTRVNDTLFDSLTVPPPEAVWFAGEGDVMIHSWIFKPPDFDARRRYPFVLLIHGGPQGAWADSWSYRWNPALWAARGYVVMAPNVRGSTGFGQEFTDQVSRDWGGKAFVDLMRALDYADSLPWVDPSRKAAAGASFGGYMVNYILGNAGNRFKALISHCGVYNFESSYGATDELWFDEWERGGTPWEVMEQYRRHSPNVYAGNFATPTLVIHGANDFRIPYTESMQLFTALQRRSVPSKFVFFPDESHWVLKPANSEFWHTTVFEWLARYLSP